MVFLSLFALLAAAHPAERRHPCRSLCRSPQRSRVAEWPVQNSECSPNPTWQPPLPPPCLSIVAVIREVAGSVLARAVVVLAIPIRERLVLSLLAWRCYWTSR